MLVAAFEVDVGRPGQLRAERQHRLVARARVEPDVEDVALALELGAAARRAGQARRGRTPRSAARTRRRRRSSSNTAAARSTSAGVSSASPHFVQSTAGNRHAPGALARDAPVGPVRDHVVDAVAAPGRDPLHVADRSRRAPPARSVVARLAGAGPPSAAMTGSPSIADEPLRRGQEDDRVVAAPAVRILSAGTPRDATAGRAPSSACSIVGLASNTRWPPNSSTVSRKWPPGPTGA